jgi:multidrug resistance efflux pump
MTLFDGPKGHALLIRMIVALEKIAEFTQPQEIIKEVVVEVVTEVVKEVEVDKLVVDEKQLQELTALKSDYELLQTNLKEANANYKQALIDLDKAKAMIPHDLTMPKPHKKEPSI